METLIYVLSAVIAVLLVAVIVLLVTRPKVVTLSDDLPANGTRYAVMKLQNEIAPYVFIKDGKICLKVVK